MADSKLKLLSLNVRGLKDNKKRREIFRWLKRFHSGKDSVIFLQETHSEYSTEGIWDKEWGSSIYFSHGTSNSRGVAILLPMKYNFTVEHIWSDAEGRVIIIKIIIGSEILKLVNVYFPTKDKPSLLNNKVSFCKSSKMLI